MKGERLKELRDKRGESQAELALAIEVTESAIAHYENGRRRPEGQILLRMAKHYNVSAEYLAGIGDDPRRQTDLPHGWEQVVSEALNASLSPEDLIFLIQGIAIASKRRSR